LTLTYDELSFSEWRYTLSYVVTGVELQARTGQTDEEQTRKAPSTLSQKSATVAVVSPFSATVSLFCDSVDRA